VKTPPFYRGGGVSIIPREDQEWAQRGEHIGYLGSKGILRPKKGVFPKKNLGRRDERFSTNVMDILDRWEKTTEGWMRGKLHQFITGDDHGVNEDMADTRSGCESINCG